MLNQTFNSYYLEMMAIIYEFNGRQYVSATTYIKLDEEIKKLKSDLSLVIKERDDNIKQNKELKSDLAFKETMLDNVKAEYESSLNIIRKLNRRIKELEQCNLNLQTWIDNKEKVNKSLREENKRLSDFLECEA